MTDSASASPPARDLPSLPLEELRAHRRHLLEQASRAARWRRLVQARLDLAVDAAVPVEDLAGLCLPLRAMLAHPPADPVQQLREADVARRDLHEHAALLQRELAAATDELVTRYAGAPQRCLEQAPAPVLTLSP